MSSSDGRWTELASQHERVVQHCDPGSGPKPARWAELASHSERLADATDPLFPLASSCEVTPGMRLVAAAR